MLISLFLTLKKTTKKIKLKHPTSGLAKLASLNSSQNLQAHSPHCSALLLVMQNPAAALKIHPSQNETNLDYIFPRFHPRK